ncbi:hypothetical protein LTR53_014377 [Teratosphaeriaceae sp. CCFEE 6253]|nr:hypothetical protein LTR53_014377 [Teratosphaeriaceae sp. CCFEE 6253]
MAVTEETLAEKYTLIRYSVVSSTQIASRVAAIISGLTQQTEQGEKPVIVCLTAQAKVASKLVSVVEIAKRDLASKGVRCFQYSALDSRLVDVPRQPRKKANDRTHGDNDAEDPDDDFEVMPDPNGATKKRNMAVMAVYLSTTAVRDLRVEYGEQRQ